MARITLQDEWDRYRRDVIPAGASPVQRIESQRAFYAGAQMVLMILADLADDAVSEDQGVERIAALVRESLDFFDRLKSRLPDQSSEGRG